MRATIYQHPRATAKLQPTQDALRLLARDEQAAGADRESVRLAIAGRDRERAAAMLDLCHDPEGLACLLRSFS